MAYLSLYLHFPFCARKCAYCDFNSHVPVRGEMDLYLTALRREIEQRAPLVNDRTVDTVYFGGGTPTLYAVEDLAAVLECLREHFAVVGSRAAPPSQAPKQPPLPEVTCEANPGTVEETYLRGLRQAGVNRLSLGVQSFSDQELRLLGRMHTADQARQAAIAARAAGFGNLSLDLIAGLPGQTLDAWEYSLEQALKLAPEHLSCYGLSLPAGTPLASQVERGELSPLDEDTSAAFWMRTHESLAASHPPAGRGEKAYQHYELSNFARSGYQCRHNLTYWHNQEYLGFGVSAASYWQGCRSVNVSNVGEYAARLSRGESVTAEAERLDPAARLGETVMLGLRLAEGVNLGSLRETFGEELVARLQPAAREMEAAGLLEVSAQHWRPTLRGMLLNNRLAAAFL